ncbi:hypothetical protein HNR42_003240 [Deinobacterium chartae]|uniref:Uncharacterized protein n=1 Tax=Deinobacterium chartae TaxID=521158 RepID=A0A841I7C8_9DEIO|nr:hypothetical protein [Deinobacterium chartae]MBB6099782.1 hypothetical protein [Deinobacterium chartae]
MAIGLIFMAENTFGNVTLLHNWWALFLLVPGVLMLGRAWTAYQAAGHRFTRDVASALYSALFPTFIGLAFLLRLDWGRIWPVFLILAGVSALLSRMRN